MKYRLVACLFTFTAQIARVPQSLGDPAASL
jgi:hypothetical protein